MANTKHIEDRAERKAAKRKLRKAFKETFAALSPRDKARFRKNEEPDGLRKWIAEQKSE